MEPRTPHPEGEAARGKSADPDELRRRLPAAGIAFLEGALQNPGVGEVEMGLLLRNKRITPALLSRIGRDRRWIRSRDVRSAVARHPRTPYPIARSLLLFLSWTDLVATARDLRVPPAVRRDAELVLAARLPELSVGERVALARRATRGVAAALCLDPDAPVLTALLLNPSLAEPEALRIACRDDAPSEVLSRLADHGSWGSRREVRLALLRNPRTPVAAALRLTSRLAKRDLEALREDERAPKIVRMRAHRRLGEASG